MSLPTPDGEHGWFKEFWASEELQEAYADVSIFEERDLYLLKESK